MLYIGLLQDTKEKKIGEAANDYIHAHYLFIEKRWLLKRNTGCLREDFYKAADSWGGEGGGRGYTQLFYLLGVGVHLSHPHHDLGLPIHLDWICSLRKTHLEQEPQHAEKGDWRAGRKSRGEDKYLSHLTKLICLCHEPSSGSQLYCFPLVLPPTLSYTAGKKKRILAFMGLLFLVTRQKYIYTSLWQTEVELLPPFKCQYKPQLLPFKIC